MNSSQVQHLLADVWSDLKDVDVLWQLGVISVALLIGWIVTGRLRRRPRSGDGETLRLPDLTGGPMVALVLLYLARPLLASWGHGVNLLNLAVPLVGSFVLVRSLVFIVRRVFPEARVLAGFERGIASVIWGAFALHIIGVLPELVGFLDRLVIPLGKGVSLWTILQATFWSVLIVLAAMWLGRAIEARVMRTETLHSSLRVALSRTVRALLVFFGVLIALPLVGIDLTLFSVFSGALGVGLGFGLQKIASNYMSGFIILLERSVRIGDIVTVDKYSGEVRAITTRYVVVRAMDGSEAIIPNETLIAQTVVNQSLSDRLVRLTSRVQVTYGADLDRALELLRKAAVQHPRVASEPAPGALVLDFADSGVVLELGYWIRDPQNGTGNVRSEINLSIWRVFRESGIEIPFPRRDVRLVADPRFDLAQVPEK